MLTPRKRKSETLSTQVLPMSSGWMSVFFHDELLGLLCIEEQIVNSAPLRQPLHLVSVVRLIPPWDESRYCGVISEYDEGVAVVSVGAVVGVECIEQGTQHAALWGASAEAESCGCMGAHSYPLRAVRQKVLNVPNNDLMMSEYERYYGKIVFILNICIDPY